MDPSKLTWRKSTWSTPDGDDCVELAAVPAAATNAATVAVRDSKDPAGPNLAFSRAAWSAFARKIKAGAYECPPPAEPRSSAGHEPPRGPAACGAVRAPGMPSHRRSCRYVPTRIHESVPP